MSKPKDKGDALEHAVLQIEELILRQDPSLQDMEARIEQNQWFDIKGVRFEVDVLVTIGSGASQYSHIIECKNWQRPVGVKEVSHLDMKRRLLSARHTTLIAQKVTAPAKNLSALHGIVILPHSEEFVPLEINAPVSSTKAETGTIAITFYKPSDGPNIQLDALIETCVFRNNVILLETLTSDIVQRTMNATETNDVRRWLPGLHTGHARFYEIYRPGELIVTGKNVAVISCEFAYSASIVYPAVVTKFGVKDRGGLIRAEYPSGTFGVENLALEILTKPMPLPPSRQFQST